MTAQPTSGVTLATWDLAHTRIGERFVVYAKAMEPSECTPAQTSQEVLAAAKARAAALGLDVKRKPPLVPVHSDGSFALSVEGKVVSVIATSGMRKVEDGDGMEAVAWAKLDTPGATYEVEQAYSVGAATWALTPPMKLGG